MHATKPHREKLVVHNEELAVLDERVHLVLQLLFQALCRERASERAK